MQPMVYFYMVRFKLMGKTVRGARCTRNESESCVVFEKKRIADRSSPSLSYR